MKLAKLACSKRLLQTFNYSHPPTYMKLPNPEQAIIDERKTATNLIFGSTVDRIPLINFPKFEISLPSLPIQRKIAAILSAYDDLIENNTRRIEILEEMARSLLDIAVDTSLRTPPL